MPMYDRQCNRCGVESLDHYEPIETESPACSCGGRLERFWSGTYFPSVIDDSIPGGLEIRHGLCNEDGTPRKYYSHSEIRAEAKRRGLVNYVRHAPQRGSDKSPYTSRWV